MRAALWLAALVIAAPAAAETYFDQRLRLHRELESLNATLLASNSATAVLQTICDRRAPGARIVARKSSWAAEEGSADAARADLGLGPDEPMTYRQVELTCAGEVLSSAENWYAPGRLTPEMNQTLTTTETPFGVVARPLQFTRKTLDATYLYEPLPPGWESQPRENFDAYPSPTPHVLRHRAVLVAPDGRPFSVVVELYTQGVLAIPPP